MCMKLQPAITGNIEIARANAAKGIVSIPIVPLAKGVPLVKWGRYQTEMPSDELLSAWFADADRNIAIIATGLVVFDCDDPAKADLVVGHCGSTPYQVRTPSGGIHLGYRRRAGVDLHNQVRIKGMSIDLRTNGGLAMIPSSRTKRGPYEWLAKGLNGISTLAELPVANIGWTRKPCRYLPMAIARDMDMASLLNRGRKYVDRFERAISGQAGHTTTFISTLKIVRFVGFDSQLAWQLLLYYNATKCDPPWERESELRHKLDDALKKSR